MEILSNVKDFTLRCGGFIERYNPSVFAFKHQSGVTVKDTPTARQNILNLHMARHAVFAEMLLLPARKSNQLSDLASKVEEIEFELQAEWGFTLDRNFHSYWCEVPHCQCPLLDNTERMGTPYRVVSENCPIHG